MQVALQAFGGGEPLQSALAAGRIACNLAARIFQALVDPLALVEFLDVHELGANGAGVGRLQARQQILQLHPRRPPTPPVLNSLSMSACERLWNGRPRSGGLTGGVRPSGSSCAPR